MSQLSVCCMGRWDIVTCFADIVCYPTYLCFFMRNMSSEDIKRQIVEALASGKLQPTNIIIGDQIQHQHNIGKVEAGGIGVQIMQPGTSSIARPKENDYNGVREYIEQRKAQDAVFKTYCKSHTRKQICERLSDEFGWTVDAHNLGVNIGRNR